MNTPDLTVDRLKMLVHYDSSTGQFTWRLKRRRCRPGDPTGCVARNGYVVVRLDNVLHYAHRLAWLYEQGRWPAEQLDHINGDRTDNRIANLREVTNAQNAQNQKRRNNTSGFPGVRRENSKWLAEIKVQYKPIRLGLFDTPEAAHAAYLAAKQKLHPFSVVNNQ